MPYPVSAVRGKNFGNLLYSDLILSLSPIAYWPLNDASGSAAVNLVSAALNGAYTACTLAQAQAPFTAPLFDGSTSYCNIYTAALNTAWNRSETSLSIWVKVAAAGVWTDATNRRAFSMFTSSTQDGMFCGRTSTNGQFTHFDYLGGATKSVLLTGQSFTAWKHVVLTVSDANDQCIVYHNGAQVGTTQTGLGTASANALTSTACCIGAQTTTPATVWSGWLAHCALWNRPLSAAEVANLYAWGVG